jgi:hypothetical protein
MLILLIGTWIQTVAQSWLVFKLTRSAFLLGLVGFLGSIPGPILGSFLGGCQRRFYLRDFLSHYQHALYGY